METAPSNSSGWGSGQPPSMDSDWGGKSSKKTAKQSGSSSEPSYGEGSPSYPSYPSQTSPSHSSPPHSSPSHGGSGDSGWPSGPASLAARTGNPPQVRPVGETCSRSQNRAADPSSICLGIQYVSYVDGRDDSVESELDAVRDVAYANEIWRDCGIQFQLDEYKNIRPQEYQLRYRTRNYDELNQIRRTFAQPGELLVVATGAWDRSGSLGNTWANAWTNLPGEPASGVVLEQAVSSYPQILAHELGHYLSLDHVEDARSLMHPVVSRTSVALTQDECQAARWAAKTYWREMMR